MSNKPVADKPAPNESNKEGSSQEQVAEWHVYIVRCRNDALYTGITTDLTRRVAEHNQGKGARYTHANRPVKLVYSEYAESHTHALRRERAIKRLTRRRKLELIRWGEVAIKIKLEPLT